MLLVILSLVCVGFYSYFGIHILRRDENSNLSRIFFLVCLAMAVWSLGYVFMFAASSKHIYEMWYKFSALGWIFIPVLIYNFLTELTDNKGNDLLKNLLAYGVSLVLLYRVFFKTLLVVDYVKNDYWKEIMEPESFWYWAYIIYALILMFVGLVKVVKWGRDSTLKREKKQVFLIVTTFPLSFIVAIFFNVILPTFYKKALPPLSHVYLMFWIAFVWYAVSKYHFIVFDMQNLVSTVVEKTMDLLILTDVNLEIKDINARAYNYLEVDKEDIIGLKLESILKCCEDEEISLKKIFNIEFGKKEMEFYKNSKESLPVQVYFKPVKDKLGDIVGILVIGRDISEMKQLQQEIQDRRVIEDNLKKALREIEETQEKLISTEKMAAAGRLAGGLAHELNSPLGAILSSAQYIKEELKDKNDNDLIESIQIVEDGVYKARKIISELLRYTNNGKKWVSRINLDEVIYDSLTVFEENLKGEEVNIKLNLEPQVYVYGNSVEIMQVVNSIISNCKEAFFDDQKDKKIKIKLYREDDKAYMEIEDNGRGMDDKTLKRVFEPFYSKSENKNKVGLGLSTAYDIIKKHKGDIVIKTEYGKWTKVIIELNIEPEYSKVNSRRKYFK